MNKLTHKYQPIVDMIELRLIRHEALLRIDGVSDIEAYTRRLERSGQVVELDLLTLQSIIEQHQAHIIKDPVNIAVNVSAVSLVNPQYQLIALALLEQRSPLLTLSLEITESAPLTDMPGAIDFVRKLQSMGCTVGMDDYGDGYASLAVLDQLHLDYLKLSSNLTTQFMDCDDARTKITDAVRFARERSIKVVAEHIDSPVQYKVLCDMGIQYGQGWLFAKADNLIDHPEQFQSELRARIRPAPRSDMASASRPYHFGASVAPAM